MRSTRLFRIASAMLVLWLAGCGMGSNRITGSNGTNTSNPFPGTSNSLTGNWSATATATMSNMNGGMPSPMLSFNFSITESVMTTMSTGLSPTASVSISNLNFTMGDNCFDNLAVATATVVGAAGTNRTLTLQFSENGNMALFSMAVPSNNNSATGTFALTGGQMLSTSMTPCIGNASGTALFSRL